MVFKRYLRVCIISLFVCGMIIAGYIVTKEHIEAEKIRQSLTTEKQVAEIFKSRDRLTERQTTRPAPQTAPPPPRPAVQTEKEPTTVVRAAEIEIFKIFKVRLDDSDSWALVFKMLVLTLGTFLGIKFINFGFRKFGGTV